ncbi:MAG: ATP-binding cassette domain-containing protein, partial [Desulfobacteraceae bacterium]
MDNTDLLEAKGLVKIYNGKRVVDQIGMTLRRKEIVGLLGPNGAGKTTTFYMIIGFTRPNGGKVYLDGEDITEAPMYLRARKGINYLAQEPSVFRKLTVEENLFAIMENINISSRHIKKRAMKLLSELNISQLAKQ